MLRCEDLPLLRNSNILPQLTGKQVSSDSKHRCQTIVRLSNRQTKSTTALPPQNRDKRYLLMSNEWPQSLGQMNRPPTKLQESRTPSALNSELSLPLSASLSITVQGPPSLALFKLALMGRGANITRLHHS